MKIQRNSADKGAGEASEPATSPRENVVWVTNIASPYRRPVWISMRGQVNLRIALLENDRRLAQDGRRGSDWAVSGFVGVHWSILKTIRVPYGENFLYLLISGLRFIRKKPAAVLIAGWESPAYWQVLLLSKLLRIRTVGFYESTLITNRFSTGVIARFRRLFFRQLDAVVVPGIASRKAVASFGIDSDRIYQGFNSVDVSRFSADAERACLDDALAPAPGHRYLYVGQLIARKNLQSLLRAFGDVRSPDDSLTLVGSGEDERALRASTTSSGLQGSVDFIHHLPNDGMGKLMGSMHTLVLVSKDEVWGLVVNEALASGMNVVVSANCGVADSVRDMEGVFVTSTDRKEIGEAMLRSKARWAGHRKNAEILQYTPERFADVFLSALLPTSKPK